MDRGHRVTVVHVARFRKWPSVGGGRPRRQLEEIVSGWRDQRAGVPADVHWLRIDPRVELRYVPTITTDAVPDGDVVIATAWQTVDPVLALPPAKGRPVYLIQGLEVWSGSEARIDATWRQSVRKVFIARWLYARAEAMGLDDIHHVVLAIDTDKFCLVRPMENRPRRVAMLAGQDPGKGLADGVAALTTARASVPDLRAVLFGVGPRPADLPAWIDYLRDPPQANLVDDVYNGSAVYLCPSHSEGWHLPAAEAMACGAAVVSTDIGGVADIACAGASPGPDTTRSPATAGPGPWPRSRTSCRRPSRRRHERPQSDEHHRDPRGGIRRTSSDPRSGRGRGLCRREPRRSRNRRPRRAADGRACARTAVRPRRHPARRARAVRPLLDRGRSGGVRRVRRRLRQHHGDHPPGEPGSGELGDAARRDPARLGGGGTGRLRRGGGLPRGGAVSAGPGATRPHRRSRDPGRRGPHLDARGDGRPRPHRASGGGVLRSGGRRRGWRRGRGRRDRIDHARDRDDRPRSDGGLCARGGVHPPLPRVESRVAPPPGPVGGAVPHGSALRGARRDRCDGRSPRPPGPLVVRELR